MIDVYFIKSLENSYFLKAFSSFKNTITEKEMENFNIFEMDELEIREKTLNNILERRTPNNDLFIVSDDIIFTENWFSNLKNNMKNGDIIGFSMAKPGKKTLSNRGFEFVKINKKISYLPKLKGQGFQLGEEGFGNCDFVTGCCMFIKSDVLGRNIMFSEDGNNRWGEILFANEARNMRFSVICLNHVLFHGGISTKNKSEKFSSTSYLIEQKIWDEVVGKHLKNVKCKTNLVVEISENLKKIIENNEKKLIYGCGFVADSIISNCKCKNIEVFSGLPEEKGLKFHNFEVKFIEDVNLKRFGQVIITAIGYEEEVIKKYFDKIDVIILEKIVKNNTMFIDLKKEN